MEIFLLKISSNIVGHICVDDSNWHDKMYDRSNAQDTDCKQDMVEDMVEKS